MSASRKSSRPASSTARFMTLFRALETCRPPARRLFEDRYAVRFLPLRLRLAVWAARVPLLGRFIPWLIDRRWPGARTSGVARTRLIDDAVLAALQQGCRQVVLLGAGFDARGYRLPGIERARVFEVDHGGTLAAKKAVVAARLRRPPGHVEWVEVDFERDDLRQRLAEAGFRAQVATIFVWEGVTNYLTADAIDATLAVIRGLAPAGSRLVFTYVHRGVLDGSMTFARTQQLSDTLRRVGEPWTFGLDPAEVGDFLAARGLRLLSDDGACDYRARYLGRRGRGYEFYRAAVAEIASCAGA